MQKKEHIPPPQETKPIEFAPTEAEEGEALDLMDKISATYQKPKYWTCRIMWQREWPDGGRHCGCEDATDPGYGPPGASPRNPIYFSTDPEHWYAPIECDEQGTPL